MAITRRRSSTIAQPISAIVTAVTSTSQTASVSAMATMQSGHDSDGTEGEQDDLRFRRGRLDTNPNDRGVQRRSHHPVWMTVIVNAAR